MEQRDINSRTRADTFGLRPDIYDALAGNMVKQTDLGSLLPNSGSCFLPQGAASLQTGGQRFLPFTVPNGTQRGCEVSSEDGLILNAIGMWRVEVATRSIMENVAGNGGSSELRLEVFDPDGNFVRRRIYYLNAGGIVLISSVEHPHCWLNVVVDRPGYRVRVFQLLSNATGMRTWNSSEYTELFAQYVYNGTLGGV